MVSKRYELNTYFSKPKQTSKQTNKQIKTNKHKCDSNFRKKTHGKQKVRTQFLFFKTNNKTKQRNKIDKAKGKNSIILLLKKTNT